MDMREEEKLDGKQTEEIHMLPKPDLNSEGDGHDADKDTTCKFSALERYATPKHFSIMVGTGALCGDALLTYLKFQDTTLRRQFEVDADTITWMSYSSEIACAISAVLLSILAKKIHLPRALAISSAVLGMASMLCALPYLITKDDLVPAPTVLKNETYSMDRYKMMAPTCIEDKEGMVVVQRLLKEAAMAEKSSLDDKNATSASESNPVVKTDEESSQTDVNGSSSSRVRRACIGIELIDLKKDNAHNGQIMKWMKQMPPIPHEIIEKALEELCFFNTGPFMVNSSTGVLKIINAAMILQGIARGPRLAYGAIFLLENSEGSLLYKHFGVLFGMTHLSSVIGMMMSMYFSSSMYITLEDVGEMTMFNPRWLGAWWLGFVGIGLFSLSCAGALFLFPRKLKDSSRYTVCTTSGDKSPFSFGDYIKDLLASSFRVFTNPIYLALVLGTLAAFFAWTGVLHIAFNYVSHQFSLEPFMPGFYLVVGSTAIFPMGIMYGGAMSAKRNFSSLRHLKFAAVMACLLVIFYACNVGLGCSQQSTDKGQRIVSDISNDTLCGSTCPCNEMEFTPACGSDGRTYYSPCHAGCGQGYNGKFHDCKCIEDMEKTVTPGFCESCGFYYPFIFVFSLGSFILGFQFVPRITATIRSVKENDVPVALGFLTMLMICVVSIPSPIVYTKMEDDQCLARGYDCGFRNTCTRYDIENARFHVFGLSLALQAVSALMFIVAFVFGRKSAICQDHIYAKDQVES